MLTRIFLTLTALLVLACGAFAQVNSSYKLRSRDLLSVAVVGQLDLLREVTVLDDGMINYPYAGDVKAAGLTAAELSTALEKKLAVYYVDPQVSVTVEKVRPIVASGAGVFSKPGSIELTPESRLLDLVAQCGGLQPTLKPEWVSGELIRNGTMQKIDMVKLLSGTDPSSNVLIQDQDVVLVQELPNENRSIKIVGEVMKPGSFDAVGPTSFASALANAGGLTPHAAMSHVVVTRGQAVIPVDLHRLLIDGNVQGAMMLMPGDTVTIPTNLRKFSVVGAVHLPGQYDVPENQPLDLVNAIALAGGDMPEANLRKVRVSKGGAASGIVNSYDLAKILSTGSKSGIPIEPGDVIYIPGRGVPLTTHDAGGFFGPLLYFFKFW